MDSMRSLNTSLPKTPSQRSAQPPEQLLQTFKVAALSVTNLYKEAVSDQARARGSGYQDALDDILAFLDKENLGLGDGEGWRVRQWATERLAGSSCTQGGGNESDDDRADTEKRARSSSPVVQTQTSSESLHAHPRPVLEPTSQPRTMSAPPVPPPSSQQQSTARLGPEAFTFRSSHQYPADVDMQTPENTPNSIPQTEPQIIPPTHNSTTAARIEVTPKGTRTQHRYSGHTSKHNTRSTTSTRPLGSTVGTKRRLNFNDYFDLGSLGDGKDWMGGGGKRGRFC
ncbi:MAG: hypothetical protein LQ342_002187 [Letrouitia transgressa]|nr:MAG: hypothetical protein LQ342_002187 [Letrouitia transgressa]